VKKIFIFICVSIIQSYSYAVTCNYSDVKLQVLGSGGPELDDGRNSSSYIVWYKNKARVLIDTGPGTSTSFSQTGAKFEDLQGILFTHFHVDHSADFPALIKGSFFTKRTEDLNIFGPAGNAIMPAATEYLSRIIGDSGAHAYLNSYLKKKGRAKYKVIATNVPLQKNTTFNYSLGSDIKASATPVDHGPIATIAWRIQVADCSIVFSGDMTNRFNVLGKFANNADILVANNSIPEKASARAMGLHMPPSQIALIAKKAKVKKLVLSHFMKRTLSTQTTTLKVIKKIYKGIVVLAEDGMFINFTKKNE
jgi:ribonuclease BN (tRNA processing enzyme)